MSLPVKLSSGILSIYGTGSTQGIDLTQSPQLQFGVVNQLPYDYGMFSVILFWPYVNNTIKT